MFDGQYRYLRAPFFRAVFVLLTVVLWSCSNAPTHEHQDCSNSDAGECAPPDCTWESCTRGVCASSGACVNPDDCMGNDDLCLDGYFCGDDGTCHVDGCSHGSSYCARGVCDPSSGQCVDHNPCRSSAECIEGERCLRTTCVPQGLLCGLTCAGDQICQYDEATLTARCTARPACQRASDCPSGRMCSGGHCVAPPECADDAFEPNGTDSAATDFALMSHLGALHASLCSGDVDVYQLAVPQGSATVQRELRVELDLPAREAALGSVAVSISTSSGQHVDRASTDHSGHVELVDPLPTDAPGGYVLRVAPGYDVGDAGIHYELSARMLPVQVAHVCQYAAVLPVNTDVDGDTSMSSSSDFRNRCALEHSGVANIYAFDVDQPSRLQVDLTGSPGARFTVGLRSTCARLDTEMACDRGSDAFVSQAETDDVIVSPGRYYLVVRSPDSFAGPYMVHVSADPIGCDPAANSCSNASGETICDPSTGQLDTRQCDYGCDLSTGECAPAPADTCAEAPLVTASGTFEVTWGYLNNDYQLPGDNCSPVASDVTRTNGTGAADAVYRVALPPHTTLRARLSDASRPYASLYILDDCLSPGDSCLAASNMNHVDAVTAHYLNDSEQPRSVFVVADSALPIAGSAQLSLDIESNVCTAGQTRCSGSNLQECDDTLSEYQTVRQCQWGCTNATCDPAPGDQSTSPAPLVNGQTFSATFAEYTNAADTDISRCSVDLHAQRYPTGGPDAFFSINAAAGDMLTVSLSTAAEANLLVFNDVAVGPSDSCVRGTATAQSVQYLVPVTGTYYIGVDARHVTETAPFNITALAHASWTVCQPGGTSCDATNWHVIVCSEDGTSELARYGCTNGCVPHGCQTPAWPNDTCASAMPIVGGTRLVDDLARFSNQFAVSSSCSGASSTVGPDAVYRVDMAANDTLSATVTPLGDLLPTVYVLTDCAAPQTSCVAGSTATNGAAHLDYHAATARSVYLVVDARFPGLDNTFQLDVDVGP